MNFETLYKLNVNAYVEKKTTGGTSLSYLSWSPAWAEFKKAYPDATYEIIKYENKDGNLVPYMYDDKTGYMCSTKVTADGITHEMWLPVMDNNNRAMKAEPYVIVTSKGKEINVASATMFDVNKTLMRCLVKNLAMFGLGLYIYAGEDLPVETYEEKAEKLLALYDEIDKITDMDNLKAFYMSHKEEVKNKDVQQYLDAQAKKIMSAQKKDVA